ncbi:MAG TPA: TolC family protein [Caulobacterales bacterium]|nr:TolC family protein [Caulobacterales bacterium]
MYYACLRRALLVASAVALAPTAHAQELSFSDAVAQAATEGPTIDAGTSGVQAATRARRAAGRLPDPELTLGLDNVPVDGPDRYRLNRDSMTMQRVGIVQTVPSGPARSAQRAVADADIARAQAGLDVARLEARLGAADAWIKLYYAERRVAVIAILVEDAHASARAARARLSGGGGVDDALAAEVDAARADDRLSDAKAAVTAARAELRRWIGIGADEPLAAAEPSFAIDPGMLRDHLQHHPALAQFAAERDEAQAQLRMAQSDRWPDWSWELSYGRRAPELSDMASVEVRIGLPLFQPWRQQPVIDARRAEVDRADARRDAAEREHVAMLESNLATYQAATANFDRARQTRLPLARQRAEAANAAYGAGSSSIATLIAARAQALETEMDVLDLAERVATLGAELSLQYGEQAQ